MHKTHNSPKTIINPKKSQNHPHKKTRFQHLHNHNSEFKTNRS